MLYKISNWKGGISFSPDEGIEDSSAYLQSINIRDNSRAISVNQALKLISSENPGAQQVVDKIIKFVEVGSNLFAFGNAGNIYKIVDETVTLEYTDTNGAILDAGYFYGNLYWATATKLSRCVATSVDFDTDTDHDWQTLTSASYHPIYPIGNRLFIGNGRYVATVSNAGAFVATSLDIESDWTVRCLKLIKPLLLIGTSANGRSKCLTWDFLNADDSFEEISGLEEGEITEFIEISGAVAAVIGKKLFWYNGMIDDALYTFDDTIAHGALTMYSKMIYLATKKGVYSFGKSNRNYPSVPNLEFVSSQGVSVDAIGAIHGTSSTLYVAWQKTTGETTTYGIDMINTAAKATQGIIETLKLTEKGKLHINSAKYFFDLLPENCSIQLKYKTENDDDFNIIKSADDETTLTSSTEDMTEDEVPLGVVCKSIQFRIELNSSGNSSPVFRGLEVDIDIN